uniref:Uncharacterized protein n=1 Tax=Lactuca sativa TaxID=4236 RepID=A0A9R1WND1_LACSA|nr:hypothetical protein LSAT_V11C100036890 [Lactuca sativa]
MVNDAMAKHKQTMEIEKNPHKRSQWAQKMDRWNTALVEVANLKGNDVNGSKYLSLPTRLQYSMASMSSSSIFFENFIFESIGTSVGLQSSMPASLRNLPVGEQTHLLVIHHAEKQILHDTLCHLNKITIPSFYYIGEE